MPTTRRETVCPFGVFTETVSPSATGEYDVSLVSIAISPGPGRRPLINWSVPAWTC